MHLTKILSGICLISFGIVVKPCTIGIATGKATADGRPLLWKTRDYEVRNNIVYYTKTNKYNFISNITPEYGYSKSWFGVNEQGFAIVNTDIKEYADGTVGPENGAFINQALTNCSSVKDFQHLLDETNRTGRTTKAVFGVIDAGGGAAIFEVNANHYWMYDVNDPAVAPEGYLVKTNFTISKGGTHGMERFKRTSEIIHACCVGDSLSVQKILHYAIRDMADPSGKPIVCSNRTVRDSVYFNCIKNICTPYSIAATVIQGVVPGESPSFTTMWTMLGNPFASVAIPYWPVGQTPSLSNTGTEHSLYGISTQLKKWLFDNADRKSVNIEHTLKLRNLLFQTEDSIYLATNELLIKWQQHAPPNHDMLKTEQEFTEYAYDRMVKMVARLKNTESTSLLKS